MLTVGDVFQERYELRQQLRAQPTRQTWLATDHSAQQPVIIKLLAFGRGMAWDEMKLFEREVNILQQLDHPQIPQYLASFHIQDPEPWLGLIQEYIPGKSLQAKVETAYRFSELDICDIATQVLEILIYLHELNPPILHRDIKPSNLILTPSQTVFLVDFGAVQSQLPLAGSSFTVVGTYGYTPLEQFGGQAMPTSDLYSLGATLLHLLTGVPPAELAQADLKLRFRDRITLSHPLTQWLEMMTAPAPADRFDSARAALSALTSIINTPFTPLPEPGNASPRIQIDISPEHLQIHIDPIWSTPFSELKDLAGMTFLTLLGPLMITILVLLPVELIYTRQAFLSSDLSGISIGILLLSLSSIPWVIGLNWLKQNLTSTSIQSLGHQFIIKYQLFGWTYWQSAQLTRSITDIYSIPITGEDATVMISGKERTAIVLANNVNATDRQLLIQTLRQWMDHDR